MNRTLIFFGISVALGKAKKGLILNKIALIVSIFVASMSSGCARERSPEEIADAEQTGAMCAARIGAADLERCRIACTAFAHGSVSLDRACIRGVMRSDGEKSDE